MHNYSNIIGADMTNKAGSAVEDVKNADSFPFSN